MRLPAAKSPPVANRLKRDLRMLTAWGRALPTVLRARPGASLTVADLLEERADLSPHQPALVFRDRALCYRELDEAANQVARWALDQGLGRGDVVALLMENRPEFVVHWLGLAKLGIVTALINTHLTGRPLAHSLEIAGARHLILDAELEANWQSAQGSLGAEAEIEVWSSGGVLEQVEARDLDRDRLARSRAALPGDVRSGLTCSDQLFYIYTSGTTGLPKAARFSHQRFIATATGANGMAGLRASDRMYIALPLYHSAGGVMALGGALLCGATAVLARRFSATHFWEDCLRHDVTAFQYIGELCRYLLNSPPHPDETRHHVRLCIGNGLRPDIWAAFQERFALPRIVEFYGATEGNVSFINLDGQVGSIGRMPALLRKAAGIHLVRFDIDREDVVRGPDGFCIECEADEPGEAIGRISQAVRFEGYSDAQASEKKILRNVFKRGDAYFRTGDLLRHDRDDYFYFVDRIGDTFRWKGENVSTGEVAAAISGCPGIREVNVYGVDVPGAEGRAGMASIVVDPTFDFEALAECVDRELPLYARPLFVRLLPEIEITGTFKHRKVEAMREGFDPNRLGDPLFFYDARAARYVPLDAKLHESICNGSLRI